MQISFVFLRSKVGASGARAPSGVRRLRASLPGPALLPCASRHAMKSPVVRPAPGRPGAEGGPGLPGRHVSLPGPEDGLSCEPPQSTIAQGKRSGNADFTLALKGPLSPGCPLGRALVLGEADPDCGPGVGCACMRGKRPGRRSSEPGGRGGGVGDALAQV